MSFNKEILYQQEKKRKKERDGVVERAFKRERFFSFPFKREQVCNFADSISLRAVG